MINLDLAYGKKIDDFGWNVIVNCSFNNVVLSDGSVLRSFQSGLYKGVDADCGELLVLNLGNSLDVDSSMADYIRKHWKDVYDIYPVDAFKGADFYRSPQIELNGLRFNLWYCGANFDCGIHNEHDFFEVHTQILGVGEMQKFHDSSSESMYERVVLAPGMTHRPFFDVSLEVPKYPWHRYYSQTPCVWLAVECERNVFGE